MAKILLAVLLFLLLPVPALAALKINEIYPAPIESEFEWVEIYNQSQEVISLEPYRLTDASGKLLKFSSIEIEPWGFAIATSSAVLNNEGGDTVFLKNNSAEVIDTVVYSEKFSSGKSYVNCPDGGSIWFVLTLPSQNSTNYPSCLALTPTLTPVPTQAIDDISISPPQIELIYEVVSKVYLSEVMVDPENGFNEWVEIYNANEFQVLLDGWYLDDSANSGSLPRKFSLNLNPLSFGIVDLTGAIFNNGGDKVRLLDNLQKEIDGFEYDSSQKGKSLGRESFTDDLFCLQNPSRGLSNNSCLSATLSQNVIISQSLSPTAVLSLTQILSETTISGILTTSLLDRLSKFQQKGINLPENKGEVLGKKNKIVSDIIPLSEWVSFFSFNALAYSVLAIISLLIKLRFHY